MTPEDESLFDDQFDRILAGMTEQLRQEFESHRDQLKGLCDHMEQHKICLRTGNETIVVIEPGHMRSKIELIHRAAQESLGMIGLTAPDFQPIDIGFQIKGKSQSNRGKAPFQRKPWQ